MALEPLVITDADRLKSRREWAGQLVREQPYIPGHDDYDTVERVLEVFEALVIERHRLGQPWPTNVTETP